MKLRKFLFFLGFVVLVLFVGVNAKADVDMLRLYNPNSGEHFYTSKPYERDSLVAAGWTYEGVGWVAPSTGQPVYRLYNPNAGDHFYTMLPYEQQSLIAAGWRDEGIGWYSGGPVAVQRAYNPNASAGAHNYTTNVAEQSSLVAAGWRNEGVAWFAMAAGHAELPGAGTTASSNPAGNGLNLNGQGTTSPSASGSSQTAQSSVPGAPPGLYAPSPTYFSQLDPRWAGVVINYGTMGPDGCVPTSLAMILVGSYHIATDPGLVGVRMAPLSKVAYGFSGKDLMNVVPSYGRTVQEIPTANQAKALLKQGVPLIFFVNVGVGHAVAAYGIAADGDSTMVFDPFAQKFYPAGSLVSVEKLYATLSQDPSDWDAGTPVFAIK